MADAAELVALVRSKGCSLALKAGELKFAPAPGISAEEKNSLISLLRDNREALIGYFEGRLREREAAIRPRATIAACGSNHCAGCYWVTEIIKLHPPRTCEEFLAWREKWATTERKK